MREPATGRTPSERATPVEVGKSGLAASDQVPAGLSACREAPNYHPNPSVAPSSLLFHSYRLLFSPQPRFDLAPVSLSCLASVSLLPRSCLATACSDLAPASLHLRRSPQTLQPPKLPADWSWIQRTRRGGRIVDLCVIACTAASGLPSLLPPLPSVQAPPPPPPPAGVGLALVSAGAAA